MSNLVRVVVLGFVGPLAGAFGGYRLGLWLWLMGNRCRLCGSTFKRKPTTSDTLWELVRLLELHPDGERAQLLHSAALITMTSPAPAPELRQ